MPTSEAAHTAGRRCAAPTSSHGILTPLCPQGTERWQMGTGALWGLCLGVGMQRACSDVLEHPFCSHSRVFEQSVLDSVFLQCLCMPGLHVLDCSTRGILHPDISFLGGSVGLCSRRIALGIWKVGALLRLSVSLQTPSLQKAICSSSMFLGLCEPHFAS